MTRAACSRSLLAGLIVLLTASSAMAQNAASPRPMTTDDGLNMVQVGNALMTPDGQSVFYRKSELDWAKNKRKNTYSLIPAGGGEAYQYIGEDGGSDFQFSPGGAYLAFKRSVGEGKDKKNQLFVMRTAGGEAVQVTKNKTAVGAYRWTSDDSALVFSATIPRTEETEKEHKNGDDAIFGGTGNDFLDGGDHNDLLEGQGGLDTITGGAGDDTLLGGNSLDDLDGGDDTDHCDGQGGLATAVNCESTKNIAP